MSDGLVGALEKYLQSQTTQAQAAQQVARQTVDPRMEWYLRISESTNLPQHLRDKANEKLLEFLES